MERSSTGLVGVGLLGAAVAERLLDAGFRVLGFDTCESRLRELERLGGESAGSVEHIATCERILLSLPNSGVVSEVLSQMGRQLQDGAIVIDTTTGDPDSIASFARIAEAMNFHYLDATIAGSSKQVREKDVLVMAGGAREDFDRCADLFAAFARQTYYLGRAGSGARMKLVTNMVLGLNRAVLAEALSFAAGCGFDPAATLEILKSSSSYSRVMDTKGTKMVNADYSVEARLSQHLKDVRLMLEAGGRSGVNLPLSRLHLDLLEEAEAAGWGDADNSAILEVFRRKP